MITVMAASPDVAAPRLLSRQRHGGCLPVFASVVGDGVVPGDESAPERLNSGWDSARTPPGSNRAKLEQIERKKRENAADRSGKPKVWKSAK
jgi:hypothetical protein